MLMRRTNLGGILLLPVLITLLAASASAQIGGGSIVGVVTDSAGAVMVGDRKSVV